MHAFAVRLNPARAMFVALGTVMILFAMWTFAFAAPVNKDDGGLAIDGNDPVAYFKQNAAVKGDPAITTSHDGAIYRFASTENRDAFVADPEAYLPQYGGYCAFGMASGYQAPVEVDKFTIVDGKLYLNYNGSVQSQWRKDIAGYNAQADTNWRKFLDE